MNLTKTFLAGILFFCTSFSLFSANITIIESQSIQPLHNMDENWQTVAMSLGHNATISPQEFLDDINNLSNADILIISSGLIVLTETRQQIIKQFVENGGNLYVQSEYLVNLPGSELFSYLVNELGGSFSWDGELTGNLIPANVFGDLVNNLNEVTALTYYWYGAYGSGDATVNPFIEYNDFDLGFVFCPPTATTGKIVTTSDQDWVRNLTSETLIANILSYMVNHMPLATLPTVSIEVEEQDPCDDPIYTFNATTENNIGGSNLQWFINGVPVLGETAATFVSADLEEGDVVECELVLNTFCAAYSHVSNPILIAPIEPLFDISLEIIINGTVFCENETVTFNANISGAEDATNLIYEWFVNGNAVSDSNSNNFAASNLDDQDSVVCVLTYDVGCSTGNISTSPAVAVSILSFANPQAIIEADQTTICEGETITFAAIGDELGNDPSYQWQVDGINVGSNEAVFSTNTLTEGQNIMCTITTNHDCAISNTINTNAITVNITDSVLPTITVSANATEICSGETVTFTAFGNDFGNDATFEWAIDGVVVSNIDSIFTTNDLNDGQLVTCEVTNLDACQNYATVTSEPVSVQVNTVDVEILEIAFENCNNADGMFEIEGIGGVEPYAYEWMNGANENLLTGLSYGKFTVTVTDAIGCSAIGEFEMGKNDAPEVSNIIANKADCEGDDATAILEMLDTTMTYSFEWTNSDGVLVSYNNHAENLKTGLYSVVITNEFGCTTMETVSIEQTPAIEVFLNDDLQLNLGESTQIEALVNLNNDVIYEWSQTEGLSCEDCPRPTINPTESTTYTVTVTNEFGCTATDEININVIPNRDVFIPNAFTPNNDGLNDYFTVFAGDNVKSIKSMILFNRWGGEIFNKTDFAPNYEPEGWNGKYDGKKLQSGVYVYLIEIEYVDGTTKIHKGDVSIAPR